MHNALVQYLTHIVVVQLLLVIAIIIILQLLLYTSYNPFHDYYLIKTKYQT